jgi:hypothetical protein
VLAADPDDTHADFCATSAYLTILGGMGENRSDPFLGGFCKRPSRRSQSSRSFGVVWVVCSIGPPRLTERTETSERVFCKRVPKTAFSIPAHTAL